MKKQTKKQVLWTKKKIITLLVLAVVLMAGSVYGYAWGRYYKNVASQASISQIRELILLAVRGVKKDAPVDPETGDIYFPESKLYLPNPSNALPFTYLFDKGDVSDSQSQLSISTYPVRGTEKLYIAKNSTELFDAVPKLQACSRGIKMVYEKFPSTDTQNTLKETVAVNSGKELFIYVEKDCPELNELAALFKNIKSY